MPRPFVRGCPPKAPRPDRIRHIERPFGWLPCRLITDGWLEAMSQPAKLLYLLLAMAADRQGLSFYGKRRIEQLLALGPTELARARQDLIDADLLAFDGRLYQLLSLPRHAPPCLHGPAQAQPAGPAQSQPAGPAQAPPAGPVQARPAGPVQAQPQSALDGQHDPLPSTDATGGPPTAPPDRLPDDVQAILDRLLGPR